MKQNNSLKKILLAMVLASPGTNTFAEITVNKSSGALTITSDINGTVIAKVVGPNDAIMVDESFSGSSFSWVPSSGPDGAYRFDVRIFPEDQNDRNLNGEAPEKNHSVDSSKSDYAGGSVEVKNGQIASEEQVLRR